MSYSSLKEPLEILYEIKRSKFHAYAQSISDRGQAMEALTICKEKYPDARHHCWAYLIGAPSNPLSVAMSDDGEPSGTAGKPILNVLQHSDIGNIVVIVSRYFGGVKLGAGGLVRAYSSSTQTLIEQALTEPYIEKCTINIRCEYALEQFVRHLLSKVDANVLSVEYGLAANIKCELPLSQLQTTKELCGSHQITLTFEES